MRNTAFFLLIATLLAATSCVSKKKFRASESARMNAQDSLRLFMARSATLEDDTARLGEEVRALRQQLDRLRQSSTSERQYLSGELSQREQQLRENERLLAEREQRLKELESLLERQRQAAAQLRQRVADALTGFRSDELSVNIRDGKVYVSLSEKLLFKSGSDQVDQKGQDAIGKLAGVLNKNPDIDITIEGHTDTVPLIRGRFEDNWDLSASRALSIVRILEKNGVNQQRITAAGRGEYVPVATNKTDDGRQRNRRTEIILSPKLDELYRLLQSEN